MGVPGPYPGERQFLGNQPTSALARKRGLCLFPVKSFSQADPWIVNCACLGCGRSTR